MAEFITDSVLLSAYDVYYRKLLPREVTFPSVVFLDSGGYEARVDHDLSEAYGEDYHPRRWTNELYTEVLSKWPAGSPPTVAVSYDSPKRRTTVSRQVAAAARQLQRFPQFAGEILIKPDPGRPFIDLGAVLPVADDLGAFTVIGVTERELGSTVFGRMKKIAGLRQILDTAGVSAPIHVFGSLDTLSTPLYFIAGAEIFDGLTWLRFGYHNGQTIYRQNYGVLQGEHGILKEARDLAHTMWRDNYYYLESLCGRLRMFARDGKFDHLEPHREVLARAISHLSSELQA